MLTGFLDDRSITSWSNYKKGFFDLIICLAAAFALYFLNDKVQSGYPLQFWLPFISKPITIAPWLFISLSTILLWTSINTTNCTDGVDGLSSTLVLIALLTMGITFYFILGHKEISAYLLVPHLYDGAAWAVMTFALSGVLMGYLWHNAFPSKVLMGDAGSRALGFYIGVCVIVSGNPFLILATSSIILVNGGMGLLKVFLLRFFKIHIFEKIRFPLHDHMRKTRLWSPTQVLVKFMILQILITIAMIGLMFKVRCSFTIPEDFHPGNTRKSFKGQTSSIVCPALNFSPVKDESMYRYCLSWADIPFFSNFLFHNGAQGF